jgi:hypothetical protein
MVTKTTITYPEYIYWKKDLRTITNIDQIFSKTTFKKILSTLKKVELLGYSLSTTDLDQATLVEFNALYVNHITQKINPVVYDIVPELTDLSLVCPIKIIQLRKNGVLLGGLLFLIKKNSVSSCYKFFPANLAQKLPISITYLAEYYFFQYAIQIKVPMLLHGMDKNCYGVNSQIGLARFKLQLGLQPMVCKRSLQNPFTSFDWDGSREVLIFEGGEKVKTITHATLFLFKQTPDILKTYESILQNKLVQTTIISS